MKVVWHSFTTSSKSMERSKEVKLAYEIAKALNDLKSIDWYISKTKKIPASVLKETLADTLSRTYLDNPAAYYNSSIRRYENHSRS